MARLGSWIRWVVGVLLAAEVIRNLVFGNSFSVYANVFAVVFLALSVLYFVVRF